MMLKTILKAKQQMIDQGVTPTHIIFPLPKTRFLKIGTIKWFVIEAREMGTVAGLKIYVDRQATNIYFIDATHYAGEIGL